MLRSIGKILITFSIVCFLWSAHLLWLRNSNTRLEFSIDNNPSVSAPLNYKFVPKKLSIRNAKIEVPIYPSEILDGEWGVVDNGVSYLASSPVPGELGNSILYGHNWANILGNLDMVKPGDEVEVTFSDSSTKKFYVRIVQVVDPSQASVLSNSNDTRITIYTCTGFLDQKRLVVVASLT